MSNQSKYKPFINLILERTGISIDADSMGKLKDSISFLSADLEIGGLCEYYDHIYRDNDAFFNLLNMLTVNETYFYREPAQIELFCNTLFPEIAVRKKPGQKICILSAGCSTGEEPYTLVTALIEKYGKGVVENIAVYGIDIDTNAIKTAKKGIYGKHSFRSVPEKIINTYFKQSDDNRFVLKSIVGNNVVFFQGNLKADKFDKKLSDLDVIFYRNVSIYFDAKAQKKIFTHLADLLNVGGYLILSATETLPHDFKVMSLIERSGHFVFQKTPAAKNEQDTGECFFYDAYAQKKKKKKAGLKQRLPKESAVSSNAFTEKTTTKTPVVHQCKDPEKEFNHALTLAENKKYTEALEILDALICQNPLLIKAYTLKASILVNLKQNEEAEKVCELALSKDPFHKDGYLICGFIKKMEEHPDEAVKRFKEALYVEPSSWIAHFYLAEIYKFQKNSQNAAREYAIVLRILEKGGFRKYGPTYFPMPFQAEDVMRLCRFNIQHLEDSTSL